MSLFCDHVINSHLGITLFQGRIQDFLLREGREPPSLVGGRQPLMGALFGENAGQNEKIGSSLGGRAGNFCFALVAGRRTLLF